MVQCFTSSDGKQHIQFNALFQTQCFYTLLVHSDTYNKNILITKIDNPINNYILILTKLSRIWIQPLSKWNTVICTNESIF